MDEKGVTEKLSVCDDSKDTVEKYPFLFSTRWRITMLFFFINTLLYMHRVNLSLAVVCMVGGGQWNSNSSLATNSSSSIVINSTFHLLNETSAHVYFEDPKDTTGLENDSVYEVSTVRAEEDTCSKLSEVQETMEPEPELDWSKAQVSFLLSSYFYGCIVSQIPAGTMADTFGGKHFMTVSLTITSACALLTPVCARTSIYLLVAIRIVLGLAGGTVLPVGYAIITVWGPPSERAIMISVVASGSLFGTIIAYFTSGLLCAYGFDNGWPSIFYTHGLLAVICLCLWVFDGGSSPSSHPRVSKAELQFIQRTNKIVKKTSRSTPWRHLLMSRPLWASFVTQCTFNWSFFTILITVPLFLKEVLKFNIKQNGIFSALPYIFTMVSIIVSGKLATVIIIKRVLGVLATRRIFTATSLIGSGVCLVIAGHLTCDLRYLSVFLLCLASTFFGMSWGGLFVNHPEFAGQFSGTALGITNTGGMLSGTIASLSAGLLTPNGTQSEWQTVFYIAAGLNLLGTLVFSTCASAKLEHWAAQDTSMTIEVDEEMQDVKPLNKTATDEHQ